MAANRESLTDQGMAQVFTVSSPIMLEKPRSRTLTNRIHYTYRA